MYSRLFLFTFVYILSNTNKNLTFMDQVIVRQIEVLTLAEEGIPERTVLMKSCRPNHLLRITESACEGGYTSTAEYVSADDLIYDIFYDDLTEEQKQWIRTQA